MSSLTIYLLISLLFFFFQAEDGIRYKLVTGVQTCALPISTHLKDSVAAGNDRRYVLTGTGDVPVKRQIAALVKIGYRGFFSFEWEKRWHPEIEEPERAIAHYATVATEYLRDARGE